MESSGMQDTGPRIDEHFDRIRANLIRCEECNENFFFDFLRHPRYFVTHFKTCHLKNVLYRFNGHTEEENQRVRFGPRRKKDATAWFSQLKSTEKRMCSCYFCCYSLLCTVACKLVRKTSEVPHAFEPNELGRRQALLHLRQFHEVAYNDFLRMLPAVGRSLSCQTQSSLSSHGLVLVAEHKTDTTEVAGGNSVSRQPAAASGWTWLSGGYGPPPLSTTPRQSVEADRSRIRRMKATPEVRKAEAERSKRRRERLTPAQRQADAERRVRKRQRIEERARSRVRRAEASQDAREREVKRSRERRQNATEQQRNREAQRSRMRRQNATEEQRLRERERCRRRYEIQKQQKLLAQESGTTVGVETRTSTPATSVSAEIIPIGRGDQHARFLKSQVRPKDIEHQNRLLLQQQAGLGRQIRSLYASLSRASSSHIDL
uniref:Uncharacterized protein n=1 Tax=Hyaloperonospora arabidopsidis (strain Emoy2) TaxID=559515 RepID=M4BKH0_HYAAE